MTKKLTLKDIAKALNVSTTTVSNAFNRPDQLSAKLRDHIVSSANELGYYGPSAAGRVLRTGRSNSIGIINHAEFSYALKDPLAVSFLQGVASVCDRENMSMMLLPGIGRSDRKFPAFDAMVDTFIIQSCFITDDLVKRVLGQGSRAIMVDGQVDGLACVTISDKTSANNAAQHLLDQGHRKFAILSFQLNAKERDKLFSLETLNQSRHHVAIQRLEGYLSAFKAAEIPQKQITIKECPENSGDAGYQVGLEILTKKNRPTAILCMSDRLAIGLMKAAHKLGIQIPDDLSIIGFDDIEAAASCTPPLTTIEQLGYEKGQLAAELAISDEPPESIELPAKLVIRQSTKSPRS